MRRFFASMIPLALLVACAGGAAPAPSSAAAPTPAATAPRLVVLVVLDQLGSWVLSEHRARLPGDGLLRRAMEGGVYHPKVEYGYAGTYTAPGHAAIASGAPPSVTGIFSNERWDAARGREVSMVDDGRSQVLGVDGAFASPSAMLAPTVADQLEAATDGQARTVALSYKDRGAILPAGKHPDAAIWYERSLPGFTTSSHYADAPPTWLTDWAAQHPWEPVLEPWTAADPSALATLGPDDGPGEGNWLGFGVTFPHSPATSESPYSTLRSTPAATEQLLSLARAAVDAFDLGTDDIPDLLVVSVSL